MIGQKEQEETTTRQARSRLDQLRQQVLEGLAEAQKRLPGKLLYDEPGSQLFDRLTALEEYYPARTEIAIMRQHAHEMAHLIGPAALLVEYGSGSSTKTRILLQALDSPAAYIPIDISREPLLRSAEALGRDFPALEVLPLWADYTDRFELPVPRRPARRHVAYYPGTTIGNFDPEGAKEFLRRVAAIGGRGSGLLIGVDLKKEPAILHRAYNDSAGINAAFNLNVLARLNRELGADFDLAQFHHYAFYNPRHSRIEMHLVSLTDQNVRIGERDIRFRLGETIWTESSYKYRVDEFAALAEAAGYRVVRVWTDPRRWFSVQYLVAR